MRQLLMYENIFPNNMHATTFQPLGLDSAELLDGAGDEGDIIDNEDLLEENDARADDLWCL